MTRQSDLSAFLTKRQTRSSTSASPSASTSDSAAGGKRTHSPPSTSKSKRVKREGSEQDVKPKKDDSDDDEGGGQRRGLQQEERGTLPPEMGTTPLAKLYDAMRELSTVQEAKKPEKNGVVVYWMRNKDLRLSDNTALSHAASVAKSLSLPLLAIHIFSPSDYKSHDRSPRRIDFQLRRLHYLQPKLAELDIPLLTFSHPKRKEIPRVLCDKLVEWGAVGLYGNLEYEVDELRRDIEVLERTKAARESGEGYGGKVEFFNDFCVVPPGVILTKQGKPYSVYSPFQRAWAQHIDSHLVDYMVQQTTPLTANDPSARDHPVLSDFFSHEIPTVIEGFELADADEKERMERLWPVGEGVTDEIMRRFLRTKVKVGKFDDAPIDVDAEEVENPEKESRVGVYSEGRNRVDWDGTSHISAYLAAGLISARDCVRQAYEVSKGQKLPDGRDTGLGRWVGEIAFRDFYLHVLCAWPRVCMNRPWNLKYDGTIEWADDENDEKFEAWKTGKTGVPIVDAAMRALKNQGYMHNRCRMIVASYLTKDLLLDWRKGERYFMQQLIDGDLSQNNAGWEWWHALSAFFSSYVTLTSFSPDSASTGTDPQPYFRIFNPISQSEKVDPDGLYIRHWVPELRNVKGKAIHDPSTKYSPAQLRDMGYLAPLVDHAAARKKAIEVYKAAAAAGA
ncbi:hypothetical protein JCM10207_005786 [Rhodosporidiobolus poonsookiae]